MSFYKIYKHEFVNILPNTLTVEKLELLNHCKPIEDDNAFNENVFSDGYFLLSGGGAYLVNERYLSVIRRSQDARVNPGKVSLFTGRSDSLDEVLNPRLLVRELFEEALVFKGCDFLMPTNEEFGDIIEKTYSDINFIIDQYGCIKQQIKQIPSMKKFVIGDNELNAEFHISTKKDINILFLFEFEVDDINTLTIKDGEFHMQDGKCIFHNRQALWLDIETDTMFDNYGDTSQFEIDAATEHLAYIYKLLKNKA